jgi:hypothetical protein
MIFTSDQVLGFDGYRQFVVELGIGGRGQHVAFSLISLAPTQTAHLRYGE